MLICRVILAFCGFMPPAFLYFAEKSDWAYADSIASVVAFLLSVVICSALRLGREKYFFYLAESGKCSLKVLFSFFTPYGMLRALRCWCFYYCIRAARTFLFLSPFLLSVALIYRRLLTDVISLQVLAVFLIWSSALLFCAIYFLLIVNSGDLLFFRLVTQSGMPALKALRKSRSIMSKRLHRTAAFRFSFFPRMLLCLFFIPGIFAYRYYKESCCILCMTAVDVKENIC